jgi:hypothetical protein
LLKGTKKPFFNQKRITFLVIGLVITLLIDTSIIKVYDLIDKYFISTQEKILLFSLNSSICLILQFIIINYIRIYFERKFTGINIKVFSIFLIAGICLSSILIGSMIFHMVYFHNYNKNLLSIMVNINYIIATVFVIRLALLFITWFKLKHNLIFLLYFITIALISFNLIMTEIHTFIKINDRPNIIREFVGGSGDITYGKYTLIDNLRKISLTLSFVFMWISSILLISNYKDNPIRTIVLWLIISIPLIYFLLIQFTHIIFRILLFDYLTVDPISVSIFVTMFQTLSQPIAGLIFGILFWNISRIISYEKDLRTFMVISGIGILLIFSANQATALTIVPYPPFGLTTITILPMGAFLVMLGIYNSATLVSENINLRKSIYKITQESKLLHLIGQAEMEKEIQKTVNRIVEDKDVLRKHPDMNLELDEIELKKYLDTVVKELKSKQKVV